MALRDVEMATEEATRQHRQLLHDLNCIPEDQRNWSPGGAGTTALQILVGCAEIYDVAAAVLHGQHVEMPGEAPPAQRSWEPLDTEEVLAQVDEGFARYCAALDGLSEADLAQTRTMPWGAEMPIAQIIWLPTMHAIYHDGQINYIQLLLGDNEYHWAG